MQARTILLSAIGGLIATCVLFLVIEARSEYLQALDRDSAKAEFLDKVQSSCNSTGSKLRGVRVRAADATFDGTRRLILTFALDNLGQGELLEKEAARILEGNASWKEHIKGVSVEPPKGTDPTRIIPIRSEYLARLQAALSETSGGEDASVLNLTRLDDVFWQRDNLVFEGVCTAVGAQGDAEDKLAANIEAKILKNLESFLVQICKMQQKDAKVNLSGIRPISQPRATIQNSIGKLKIEGLSIDAENLVGFDRQGKLLIKGMWLGPHQEPDLRKFMEGILIGKQASLLAKKGSNRESSVICRHGLQSRLHSICDDSQARRP